MGQTSPFLQKGAMGSLYTCYSEFYSSRSTVTLHVMLGSILLEVEGILTELLTPLYYVSHTPALASEILTTALCCREPEHGWS